MNKQTLTVTVIENTAVIYMDKVMSDPFRNLPSLRMEGRKDVIKTDQGIFYYNRIKNQRFSYDLCDNCWHMKAGEKWRITVLGAGLFDNAKLMLSAEPVSQN